ncbi:sigma-70 family RNA polymerase sigma factor [Streptomyces clavuligerus]|nr:sigma-70 family RNA polymerase sigma factor [Streptomyces clavuligerus]ANW22030.1 RNA polymerase [Streptomyces clavuligerus]AXU16653.1 sigma-70 family RNA polymerase sigma factor [Streptomyces clavuligerus]EDY51631.1 RNA polymerase [Streptomyces clavuligerus]MBY6305113.1 sigma-70 family RNA polymerase sigma factor [Streptomyces clavuligerus]QCS09419.1 RNA polymerase [Streptomyces clavuligerus]
MDFAHSSGAESPRPPSAESPRPSRAESPRPSGAEFLRPPGEEFLRALYAHHGSVMLRFAARLLGGDWHRAEDVFQEAALRAWQHAGELDPTTVTLRPWLFTVIRNLVIDDHRVRRARPPEEGAPPLAGLPVSDGVDHTLTSHVVVDALRDLAPYQQEVLLHVYYLGRSVRQTALALGVPPGTVKSRTHYAIRALRAGLTNRGLTAV